MGHPGLLLPRDRDELQETPQPKGTDCGVKLGSLGLVFNVKKAFFYSSLLLFRGFLQEISKTLKTFIPNPLPNPGEIKKRFCFVHVQLK